MKKGGATGMEQWNGIGVFRKGWRLQKKPSWGGGGGGVGLARERGTQKQEPKRKQQPGGKGEVGPPRRKIPSGSTTERPQLS